MQSTDWVMWVLIGAVAARPAHRALTAGRPDRVRQWAVLQGLPVEPENEGLIAAHRRPAGRWRLAGAVAGFTVGVALSQVSDAELAGYMSIVSGFLGYLGGVLAGELTAPRRSAGERRAASLDVRRLEEYVPPRAVRLVRAGAVTTAGLGLVVTLLPQRNDWALARPVFLAVGLAAAAVEILAERLARVLLERPQPVASRLVLATDDALRSSGVRAVWGATAALLCLAASVMFGGMMTSDVQVLRWVMWLPGTLLIPCSLFVWQAIADPGAWRVARHREPRPGMS